MSFDYINQKLHAEGVALDAIATAYGTPCYVYSRAALSKAYLEYATALQGENPLVC